MTVSILVLCRCLPQAECPAAGSRGHWLQNVWTAGNGTTCVNATVAETEVSVEDDGIEQVILAQ